MSRWLPAPLLSAVLFVVWLLLAGSLAPAHLVLAAVLALAVPRITERGWPARPRLKKPATIARLGLVVLWDIVRSNIEVARRILGPQASLRPGFVWVPLDLREAHGILTLAGIITMTPGTLTVDVSDDRGFLLVHALHVDDAAALVAQIKARYEQPLREIFD
jgi:multicomponent K+:H+ antiporter subunit E